MPMNRGETTMTTTRQPGPLEARLSDQLGSVADECRALGLAVGDTIEGTETVNAWWQTTRLTLLWLGETHAAWRVHWAPPLAPERNTRPPLNPNL
jgi:hypothetical protein